ncbi:hypothetical protein SCLCIDRAFT_32496 [Scleroderma citrinum Foug A]|uniref:Uncharacterized protein n=1 Tax=Scleroderma citrinum Foug A TaxID=1036808 RepID=A0A0C2YSG2_9AGAM|nr:hypothetical protein SCLCIDRAFT_32496 [Scleroderma citrinum Foug A]
MLFYPPFKSVPSSFTLIGSLALAGGKRARVLGGNRGLLDGVFMSWETHLRDQPSAPGFAALIRLVPNIVHFVSFAPA